MSSVGTATDMVLCVVVEMKVSAYTNSFQERVKLNMPEKTTPGIAMGRTIRTMAPMRPHPSIIAHSSMSRGMDLK